jgi:tetratricopeptide (TPR) repeat protein
LTLALPLVWLACAAFAGLTQEGQTTYWDMLMQAQSARDLRRGAQMMEEKRHQDAVREFAKAVVRSPGDPLAHRMLGVAYYWSGQVDLAEAEFQESLKLEPDSAQTHVLLGIIWAWRGDAQRAYGSFQTAARLEPGRSDIQMNLGSVEEGMGRYGDALDHFRKAVAYEPSHPLYRFQLGSLYRRLGRDEEAVAELSKAVSLYSDYQEALLELGALYERMGRSKEALDAFQGSVRLKSRDSVARLRLARSWMQNGKPERARSVLGEVFHLTPEGREGGLALSLSYGGKSGEPDEQPSKKPDAQAPPSGPEGPLDLLARNLARIPIDRDASLQVDMVFFPKPKLVKAERREEPSSLKRAFDRASAPAAAQPIASRRQFELQAASPADRQARIASIVSDLRRALAQAPPDAEVRFGMNLAFSDGASREAGESREKGRVSYQPHDVGNDMGLWVIGTGWMSLVSEVLPDPDQPGPPCAGAMACITEGVGFASLGRSKASEEAFERAISLDPREALAHLGLGVSRVIRGDEAGALSAYRRALELDPRNKSASEGLRWLQREPLPKPGGGK